MNRTKKGHTINVCPTTYRVLHEIAIVYSSQLGRKVSLGRTVAALAFDVVGDLLRTGELTDAQRERMLDARDALDED